MLLQANITRADLGSFLRRLTPLAIRLSDVDHPVREVVIAPPDRVELVADRGLRVVTTLSLHWTMAGLEVPITATSAQLLLLPALVATEDRQALVFSFHLEAVDLRHVPAMFDETIRDRINKAFEKEDAKLSWDFLRSLTFGFEMPARVSSVNRITLRADGGTLRVSEEGFHLGVSFETEVVRASLSPNDAPDAGGVARGRDVPAGASPEPPAIPGHPLDGPPE